MKSLDVIDALLFMRVRTKSIMILTLSVLALCFWQAFIRGG